MTQISVNDSDKEWFDEFKGDRTQAEAFAEMVRIVRAFEGEPVDVEQLADELSHTLVTKIELAAYRGALDALEETDP